VPKEQLLLIKQVSFGLLRSTINYVKPISEMKYFCISKKKIGISKICVYIPLFFIFVSLPFNISSCFAPAFHHSSSGTPLLRTQNLPD